MVNWLNLWSERGRRKATALKVELTTEAVPHGTAAEPAGPLGLFRAGRLEEADALAQERLAMDQGDAESLQVRGWVALAAKDVAVAQACFEQLVTLRSEDADVWVDLGRALTAVGRSAAALQAYDKAGVLQPEHPGVLSEKAVLAVAAGRDAEAQGLLDRVTGVSPRAAIAHYELGNRALQRNQLDAAFEHFRRAVAHDDSHATAHANLGAVLKDRRNLKLSAFHLARALVLDPALAQAAYNLAMLKMDERQWDVAAGLLRQSLGTDSRQADAQYWLGNALMGLGDAAEARKAYQAALRIDSNYVQARWGFVMAQLPAIAREPHEQEASAAAFARELNKLKAWLRSHRPALAYQSVGAQQPFYLAYIEQDHHAILRQYGELAVSLMSVWARKVQVPPPPAATGQKIRVGIVSAHIHNHSVWHAVLRGWVEHLDPQQFELQIFHVGTTRDAETEWAQRRVVQFHHGLGEWTGWAKAISDARCDVLIYPEIGMDTTTVRLSSLRLARVQLASWGHPVTTGLPTIDGYISAQAFEPEHAASHYTEKLLALPRLGCAYRPYGTVPRAVDTAAMGVSPGDRVLLCAGNAFKYAPRDDQMYVDIARRCSPCKLLFFSQPQDLKATLLQERLRKAFAAAAVDFDTHVRFVPWQSQEHFFGLLKQAHVFLDSPGFSGFNTAMQAVECETPVMAWEGQFMRGRFASGILAELGMGEWIARNHQEFAAGVEALCVDAVRVQVQAKLCAGKSKLFHDRGSVEALASHLQTLARL